MEVLTASRRKAQGVEQITVTPTPIKLPLQREYQTIQSLDPRESDIRKGAEIRHVEQSGQKLTIYISSLGKEK